MERPTQGRCRWGKVTQEWGGGHSGVGVGFGGGGTPVCVWGGVAQEWRVGWGGGGGSLGCGVWWGAGGTQVVAGGWLLRLLGGHSGLCGGEGGHSG